MTNIREVKDYEMDYDYAIENFFGLSIEEQIFLLNSMKKVALRTNDKELIRDFGYAFDIYFEKIRNIYLAAKKYYRLKDDIKKMYSINVINAFTRECQRDLKEIYKTSSEKNLYDDLEYNIYCDYYEDLYWNTKLTNPDKIYLQDLKFNDNADKELFCGNISLTYKNKNTSGIPMQKRLIELFDPILLDIYGEDIYNFIKSFHHSFAFSIIDQIATNHMPNGKDNFISDEVHKYFAWKDSPESSLDEDLNEARKRLIEFEKYVYEIEIKKDKEY